MPSGVDEFGQECLQNCGELCLWKWARLVTSAYRNGCNRSKCLECESGCDWPGKSVEVGGIGDLLSEMGRYLWKWLLLVESVLTLSGNLTH